MLSDAEIERLMEVFQDRMQDVTDEYLELIGKHIAEIGTLAPSDINRLIEMNRVNKDMSEIQRKLAAASGKSLQDIAKIFRAVAASDSRFAEKYFGRKATAASMRSVIEAQLRVTHGAMQNLSQTTLMSQPYRKAVDSAIQAVQSGVGDYRSSIRRALRNCAAQGLKVTYPSGYSRRADSAVRQNVMDGVRAVNQQMLYAVGEEFGADGVEITVHDLCAPDHLPYQGRQFDAKTFHSIQSTLRRPFGMWNCKHTMFPIIMGISVPAHSEAELEEYKRKSTEPITIDGQTKTRYEWSQEMRRTETALRSERDAATLLKASGDKEGEKESLRKQQALKDYYGKISDSTGVKMDWSRAQASGLPQEKTGKTPTPTKSEAEKVPKFNGPAKETPPTASAVDKAKASAAEKSVEKPAAETVVPIQAKDGSQFVQMGHDRFSDQKIESYTPLELKPEVVKGREINFEEIDKSQWFPGAVPNSHEPVHEKVYTDKNGKVYEHHAIDPDTGVKTKLSWTHHPNDVPIAGVIAREIGGLVHIMPRVTNPQSVSCADYIIEVGPNRYFVDLKTVETTGPKTVYNNILKAHDQAEHFVVDVTQTTIDDDTILSNMIDLFSTLRAQGLESVAIVRNGSIARVFRRIKK